MIFGVNHPVPSVLWRGDAGWSVNAGNVRSYGNPDQSAAAAITDSVHDGWKNRGRWTGFLLAEAENPRYTSSSTPVGPLPQGTLSLGGFSFSCGGDL